MPIENKGVSEYRDVTITFDDGVAAQGACSLDAYKAALKWVEQNEAKYALSGSFTDLAGSTILVYGATPFQVHRFTVTTTIASGDYEMVFDETAAIPSELS